MILVWIPITSKREDASLFLCLQVLCMSTQEFMEFKENDGWEEDEEDDERISAAFSNEGLPALKSSWKWLIHEAARLTVTSYGGGVEGQNADSDQELVENKAAHAGLSTRQQRALQVRFGQKRILHRLLELTQD